MATHTSTLAWKIPSTEETAGRLQSTGSLSQTWLRNFIFTFHFPALEKEMVTHSSILAWRIPGTEEPGGLPSMGSHRVGHNWSVLAAATQVCLQKQWLFLKREVITIVMDWVLNTCKGPWLIWEEKCFQMRMESWKKSLKQNPKMLKVN